MATVALVGTFDTKGAEYAYLRDQIERAGCAVVMIDAGVVADPDYRVEFSRADVAAAVGADVADLAEAGDRGRAVATQAAGAAVIAGRLYEEDRLEGICGIGGSGGSSIVSRAMRELPIGVPKLLVSTMASGDTTPYVDTSDMAMMYSVVDFAGINQVSSQILANAAAGIAGMARGYEAYRPLGDVKPLVGATMYGTTTHCVNRAQEWLADVGYEVLVFHATGPGGRAMEALMESGHIVASLDITTTELMDELAGGTTTAGPQRLDMAGELGLPQVVAPGAADMITFRPPEAVPAKYRDRTSYEHNHAVTLIRSDAKQMAEFGLLLSKKLNRAKGPVAVFVPLRGLSEYGAAGGVFHDPAADAALFGALRESLDERIELVEMDCDINDPVFAVAMAQKLDELYNEWVSVHNGQREGEGS